MRVQLNILEALSLHQWSYTYHLDTKLRPSFASARLEVWL